MDVSIRNLGVLNIGGIEVWITETMVGTWIIMGALILLAIVVRIMLPRFNRDKPKGFQNVIESIVEGFDKIVHNAAGEKMAFLGNWYFTVFVFVLLANISGLFYLRPPTADVTLTFALALSTFVLIHVMGARFRKMGYLRSLCAPFILFLPMNLIGELARPISLSFRMFGNILAGTLLLTLMYTLAPVFLRFILPIPLHIFFDIFAGVIQTYVFCLLSLSFISGAAAVEDQ